MARTTAQTPSTQRRTRGFEAASGLLKDQVRVAGESRGFAVARLLTHWSEIAGEQMAAITRPVKVGYGREGMGATLTLLVQAAQAPMVQMDLPRLKERVTQLAGTLSGGEQQMLAIGRGLMAEPRLLILDEPSLGLSPLLVEEMFALIAQLRSTGLAVLLVEQNVGQSLDIADRAYVMENGAIRFAGTPAELLASDTLRQAYLGM